MANGFEFETKAGGKIALPPMKSGVLRKYRRRNEMDFIYSVMEDLLDEKTLALTDDLEVDELGEMFQAWGGDLAPGESAPSST